MITRFAPSPTGPLHLGHAYSALYAYDLAQKSGGTFLLRIEDIDRSRSRDEWETQIYEDLEWLGIRWSEPVLRQSANLASYRKALLKLNNMGLLYNCACSRRDIIDAATAPQEGSEPLYGPDGLIYPGTCRDKHCKTINYDQPLRLNAILALEKLTEDLCYFDFINSRYITMTTVDFLKYIGDFVISRRDMGTSYHLAVTIDDAAQGVTDVVRGEDLAPATPIHVLLQKLLGLPTPRYHHHRLIRDDDGKRLAKRDDARAIRLYRENGATPADIRKMVKLPAP